MTKQLSEKQRTLIRQCIQLAKEGIEDIRQINGTIDQIIAEERGKRIPQND